MDGQWVEDPKVRSGWRWDDRAPAVDPSPTFMLPARAALGRYGSDDDPAGPPLPPLDHDAAPELPEEIVVCHACGTAVSPDRLRG
ncbi:MAG: hypothetical protein L0I76_18340 [Pseudonocardia sp.]|nr:hypothetical protein [Pseudonocardia sp.]